jgi:hypothetical protein
MKMEIKEIKSPRHRKYTTIMLHKSVKEELENIKSEKNLESLTDLFKYFIILELKSKIKF